MVGVMRLNHLNLTVTDVLATVSLLETYFGFTRSDMPCNEHMAFLHDESGFLLSMFRAVDVTYPKMFHIGFLQDSAREVHAMHRRLTEGGFDPPMPREDHGRLTFYFQSGTGVTIEVEALQG
jgi:lactoylglutathione lyase